MPDRDSEDIRAEGPIGQQVVVGIFITLDHVGNQSPVKTRMRTPFVHPGVIFDWIVAMSAFPGRERTIIKYEGLADIGNGSQLQTVGKRDHCVPPFQNAGAVDLRSDRNTVIVDHLELVWRATNGAPQLICCSADSPGRRDVYLALFAPLLQLSQIYFSLCR